MSDQEKISGISRRDNYSTSKTETGRPSRAPDDKDGFRKVIERREERTGSSKDDEDDTLANGHGIFDLTAKKAVADSAVNPQQALTSPFDLIGSATKQAQAAALKQIPLDAEAGADLAGLATAGKKDGGEEPIVKGRSFAQVQDDLAGLQQMRMAGPTSNAISMGQNATQATAPTLETLVDQIVDKLYTVKSGDITDTVMTIKNPPVLAGSELIVTSYDSARGEFNIAFANLTQEAKMLLDSQQANLLAALERQGYVAHIVVTTTESYQPESSTLQQQASGADQQRQDKQDAEKERNRGQQRQQG